MSDRVRITEDNQVATVTLTRAEKAQRAGSRNDPRHRRRGPDLG